MAKISLEQLARFAQIVAKCDIQIALYAIDIEKNCICIRRCDLCMLLNYAADALAIGLIEKERLFVNNFIALLVYKLHELQHTF